MTGRECRNFAWMGKGVVECGVDSGDKALERIPLAERRSEWLRMRWGKIEFEDTTGPSTN